MLVNFTVSDELSFVIKFGDRHMRFFADHGVLLNASGSPYEIASPYGAADLSRIKTIQNGDYLYLFHPKYPIKTLGRYGNTDWRLEDFELKNGPWESVNTSENALKISAVTGDITITADTALFAATDVGRLVRITNLNDDCKAWQAETDIGEGDVVASDGKYYKALAAGKTGTVKPVHSEGSKSDGKITFRYLHAGYGVAKITGYTGPTVVSARVVDEFPEELVANSSAYWELGLVHSGRDYPVAGEFYKNRFHFLINNKGLPYVCHSCSGDYNNFADKEHGEILATSAFTTMVVGQEYNEGRWLCASANVLFVGTSSGEYYIAPATTSEAFGPENSDISNISSYGSPDITPVKIGGHVIFASNDRTTLRDMVYSYATDSYDPADISIYYRHLLTSKITGMVYQENPDKILWLTVGDGRLIGVTFSAEQEVNAAHQHTLGGKVLSAAVCAAPIGSGDDLWMEISRSAGGETIESVGWMGSGEVGEYPDSVNGITDLDEHEESEARSDLERAFFMDGGLEAEREVFLDGSLKLAGSLKKLEVSRDGGEYEKLEVSGSTAAIYVHYYNNRKLSVHLENIRGGHYELTFPEAMVGCKVHRQELNAAGQVLLNAWDTIPANGKIYRFDCQNADEAVAGQELLYTADVYLYISNFHKERKRISIGGLEHLEGREVAIQADGAEEERQIVKNGSIEIWDTVRRVKAGLPVDSVYMPLPIVVNSEEGSGFGDVQRLSKLLMMLYRSGGGQVGGISGEKVPVLYRKADGKTGQPVPLFSGNKLIEWPDRSSLIEERGARIVIANDSVFPMNIMAICPYMEAL